METSNKKRKQGNFFNPFIICSSCKRKFVDGPFVDEETNGSICKQTKQNEWTCHI
jgi:hypothetical protein